MQEIIATEIMLKYLSSLNSLYGMYLDACSGFFLHGDKIRQATRGGPRKDPRVFMGDFNDPNDPEATYKHSALVSEIGARNARGGTNEIMLSRACLFFAFASWETTRPEYAEALGIDDANDIKINILGDMRHYRNAIAHAGAVLQKPTKELQFFKVGEPIDLVQSHMDEIFVKLVGSLILLNKDRTGLDLQNQFERPLNRAK